MNSLLRLKESSQRFRRSIIRKVSSRSIILRIWRRHLLNIGWTGMKERMDMPVPNLSYLLIGMRPCLQMIRKSARF